MTAPARADGGLDFDVDNLASLLRRHARATPDKRAIAFPSGRDADGATVFDAWTYADVDRISDGYARGLRKVGVRRGTKTIVMLRPGPELFALVYALFKLGAVPVIVDPGMGPKRMLHCYETVKAEAFVGVPIAHTIRALRPKTFAAAKILVTVGRAVPWGGVALDDIAEASDTPFEIEKMSGDDTLVVNFTTGSTGPARGVEYTHAGVLQVVRGLPALYGDVETATSFVTLPLFALFDMLLGVSAVLAAMDPTKPALVDAQRMIDDLSATGANTMFASPAFLARVGRHAVAHGQTIPSLRVVVAGGAPVMPRVLAQFRAVLDKSAKVFSAYGATEALPMASIEGRELLKETKSGTASGAGTCAGRAFGDNELRVVRIVDGPIPAWRDDLRVVDGEVGEIVVRGRGVSPRYHEDATNDALAKIRDGATTWHRTGDLGWLDGDGRLWFCGRKGQTVTTPRRALYTVQCEGIFNAHDDVQRTALVGVGPRGAQRPVLCVELREPVDPARLAAIEAELATIAASHEMLSDVRTFLFHPGFPVDIRHNAKIGREELAVWAARRLGVRETAAGEVPAQPAWTKIVPILGWLYLAYGLLVPFTHRALIAIWWIDAFLSIAVHGLQLFASLPKGKRAGYGVVHIVASTLLFGATWWKLLEPRELRGRMRIALPEGST
jgi:acyl-CoA synthetase (AMP-forming)/AMP-acid ligase II